MTKNDFNKLSEKYKPKCKYNFENEQSCFEAVNILRAEWTKSNFEDEENFKLWNERLSYFYLRGTDKVKKFAQSSMLELEMRRQYYDAYKIKLSLQQEIANGSK